MKTWKEKVKRLQKQELDQEYRKLGREKEKRMQIFLIVLNHNDINYLGCIQPYLWVIQENNIIIKLNLDKNRNLSLIWKEPPLCSISTIMINLKLVVLISIKNSFLSSLSASKSITYNPSTTLKPSRKVGIFSSHPIYVSQTQLAGNLNHPIYMISNETLIANLVNIAQVTFIKIKLILDYRE